MSFLNTVGTTLQILAGFIKLGMGYAIPFAMAVVILLLLVRFVVEHFKLSPFGKVAFYAMRPTESWVRQAKSSQFYYGLKKALPFEPVWLLLLLGFAFFFYLLSLLANDVIMFLLALSQTCGYFGNGRVGAGVQALIGCVLLFVVYSAMAMMTILIINSFFGLFRRPAQWAGKYIYPLLSSVDRTGSLAPLIFLLAFWLLGALASAVQISFFQMDFRL